MIDGWKINGEALNTIARQLHLYPDSLLGRRGENVIIAGRPGARHRSKPHSQQVQTFVLELLSVDEFGNKGQPAFWRNMDRLKALLAPELIEISREIQLTDGRHSTRTGTFEVVAAPDITISQRAVSATVTWDALFPDPYWYEPARVLTGQSGGFVVFNPGTVRHYNAVVRIHGPATDPTLTSNGAAVTVVGTIADGDWVELDSDLFTAVDDTGTSVAGAVSRSGSINFVEISPGYNTFDLSDGTCDVSFRPAFM